MRGELGFHVIHVAGMQIIEAGIYGLSRGNSLGGMMMRLIHLHFFSLDQVVVARSSKLETWIRTWWG